VIFFTLEGGDVSVALARRGSSAPFRPREEYSQSFAASRRFAFKDLNEGSKARAAVPTKSVPPRRLSRASARLLRRAMVGTMGMLIPGPFIHFDAKQWNHEPKHETCVPQWAQIRGVHSCL
jgi:hypothetical protein